MTREQFDEAFSCFQLSEIVSKSKSKRKVKQHLETFVCTKNLDLQDFLHNKALTFEQHLRSRTYLYFDNDTKEIAAYYTIAISVFFTDGISANIIKLLDGYKDDTKTIPCFLIGQLGKSDKYDRYSIGEYMLADALEVIDESHKNLGGRFILIDSVNNPKVLSFYQDNSFLAIENDENSQSIKMIKPYFEEFE